MTDQPPPTHFERGLDVERVARWLYAEYHALADTTVWPPGTIPWDEVPSNVRSHVRQAAEDFLAEMAA